MSTAKVNEILNNAGTALPDNLLNVTLFASVVLDGDPVTILASHNISSITDRGVGNYTVNFTSPASGINNYAVTAIAVEEGVQGLYPTGAFVRTVNSFYIDTYTAGGVGADPTYLAINVFDLGA